MPKLKETLKKGEKAIKKAGKQTEQEVKRFRDSEAGQEILEAGKKAEKAVNEAAKKVETVVRDARDTVVAHATKHQQKTEQGEPSASNRVEETNPIRQAINSTLQTADRFFGEIQVNCATISENLKKAQDTMNQIESELKQAADKEESEVSQKITALSSTEAFRLAKGTLKAATILAKKSESLHAKAKMERDSISSMLEVDYDAENVVELDNANVLLSMALSNIKTYNEMIKTDLLETSSSVKKLEEQQIILRQKIEELKNPLGSRLAAVQAAAVNTLPLSSLSPAEEPSSSYVPQHMAHNQTSVTTTAAPSSTPKLTNPALK